MACYHVNTSPISRAAGHSATAKCAYISGDIVKDQRTGEVFNYKNRKGIEYSEVITPSYVIKELSAEELWNKAELSENRSNSRVGREWVVALPYELNSEQRKQLSIEIAGTLANQYQVATQIAIHAPSKTGDDRNYHVHILTTTRKVDVNLEFTEKSNLELSNKQCKERQLLTTDEQIKNIRGAIADTINKHLSKAQIKEQVSHLSFKEQNIEKIPTKHMGKNATYLERKGFKTEIGNYNRSALRINELNKALGTIYEFESPQIAEENKLSATERTKLYLEQLKSEKEHSTIVQEKLTKTNSALLQEILTKHSYKQIVERNKEAVQQQKENSQEKQLDTENKKDHEFNFSR